MATINSDLTFIKIFLEGKTYSIKAEEIKTEDFYNHFGNIHEELTTKSTAELILNDFLE